MNAQRIELRALVPRSGRVLLVREPGSAWQLPGGSFDEEAEDMDAAMDSFLRMHGVASADMAQAFLRTCYGREGDTRVVINLYAPLEWYGEPAADDGVDLAWVDPADLAATEMAPAMLRAALVGLGLAEEEEPEIPGITGEPPQVERPAGRHASGLDVLRTLRGVDDPGPAYASMQRSSPELAPDIVDFALGDVWSNPALSRKTRSLQVVAMVAAMGGRPAALRSHLNGALNHGASPDELVQTLRMVAVYAGFPAALEAWPVMEAVFAARGIVRPGAGE